MAQNAQEGKVIKAESYYAISGAAILNISNILGEIPCRQIAIVERVVSILNTVQELAPPPSEQPAEVPTQPVVEESSPMRV